MRLKHKPLEYEVWENRDGLGAEPMPDWVKAVAEPSAKPGTTFLIDSNNEMYGRRLVPAGHYLVQGPTDVYPCSPRAIEAVYEVPQPNVVATADLPPENFQQAPKQTFGTEKQ